MTTSSPPKKGFSLSEDWLATIIGLILVLILGLGLLGPGAQKQELKAAPGEAGRIDVIPLAGWKAIATVGGEKVTIADIPTTLERDTVTAFTCADGQIALDPEQAATISARSDSKAGLLLVNNCDANVVITFTTSPIIRWPLLDLFAR